MDLGFALACHFASADCIWLLDVGAITANAEFQPQREHHDDSSDGFCSGNAWRRSTSCPMDRSALAVAARVLPGLIGEDVVL